MYIIEKIIRLFLKMKKREQKIIAADFNDNYVLEDVVTCNHQFIPIDSTGKIFACSKCGYLVKKSRLKKKNQ